MRRELPPERLSLLRPNDRGGVSGGQAEALRRQFGTNVIAERPARSFRDVAGDTAMDPMLWFLAATSAGFAVLGQTLDAVVLVLAIIPIMGMDFYLHRRTEASLKGFTSALATHATAMRDGHECTIPATDLVPGDLVRVRAGGPFPADGLILSGHSIQTDESSLTGEAYPVPKQPLANGGGPTLPDENWVFAGTRSLTGEALMRVIFTGQDTIYGNVVCAATATRKARTPLQRSVAGLVRVLLVIAACACVVLAAVRIVQGYGIVDAFLSAAILAVAAIPEEFPVVLTFFLGVGVFRLARANALVRQAVAVENIGRVSVICSDKTGTITEGRLTVHQLHPAQGTTPDRLLELGRMASRWETGDPLDRVLLLAEPEPGAGPLASFPFTEARRREVAIWPRAGRLMAAAKGAPETILGMCQLDEPRASRVRAETASMADAGQKVIACAWREIADASHEPATGFSFAGLIGISDPVRAGVREAIDAARDAGIRVVMVTGDHQRTAAAIARESGLSADPIVLSGDDLQGRLAKGERAFLEELDAVARATPAQKVLLVEAMREAGAITAVTGDGVNDVPALKAADVGIAMGLRGTQSAREIASIVLLDDNFSTIVRAIAEGRQLFRNLVRSFAFLLMVHIPLVTTAAAVPLLGYPLLYLPIHIVILELMIHPSAILGFQRSGGNDLGPSIDHGRGFFTGRQRGAIALTGALIACGIAILFVTTLRNGGAVEHARAMSFVALASSLIVLFAILTRLHSTAPKVIAAALALLTFAASGIPEFADLSHLHSIGARDGLVAVGVGALSAMPGMLFREAVFQKARVSIGKTRRLA